MYTVSLSPLSVLLRQKSSSTKKDTDEVGED